MSTARNLTITSWRAEADDAALTVAVPGLKLTGWWPNAPPPDVSLFDGLQTFWPTETGSFLTELDILEDSDQKKHQICAYVRVRVYPDQWLRVIRDSLRYFTDRGAAIAWTGGWECFLRYLPTATLAGCYAAYTPFTDLVCFSDLDEPIHYLNENPDAVLRLHNAVAHHSA